jgi:hypothetical protein
MRVEKQAAINSARLRISLPIWINVIQKKKVASENILLDLTSWWMCNQSTWRRFVHLCANLRPAQWFWAQICILLAWQHF